MKALFKKGKIRNNPSTTTTYKIVEYDKIDSEIEHILGIMKETDPNSEEYTKLARDLEILCKAKSYNKQETIEENSSGVSHDLLAKCAFSALEVAMIIGYEYAHVLASKALNRTVR